MLNFTQPLILVSTLIIAQTFTFKTSNISSLKSTSLLHFIAHTHTYPALSESTSLWANSCFCLELWFVIEVFPFCLEPRDSFSYCLAYLAVGVCDGRKQILIIFSFTDGYQRGSSVFYGHDKIKGLQNNTALLLQSETSNLPMKVNFAYCKINGKYSLIHQRIRIPEYPHEITFL